MLQLLSGNPRTVDALGFLLAFALTALMDSVFHDKLPHDHGRAFAVNGELSKGKARGSGLIFVLCIALVTLAVVPFKTEYVIYTVLLIASMLSGYFDDAAETAWNEYKKGLIDLVIAVVAGVTYLNFNGTEVNFLSWSFSLPYAVYLILIIVLIWASINVVNCTDGVDGLSASLAVVSIGTFLLAYWEELGDYATAGIVFIGALLAYLWQNAKPSTLLMGDAGSRAMGFFLAVLALKSSHPFAFLLAALVFIVDGSLGILKISFKRFLHISILKNTLTPLHDHVRKRLGWSDEQVVARWLILQCVASALLAAAVGAVKHKRKCSARTGKLLRGRFAVLVREESSSFRYSVSRQAGPRISCMSSPHFFYFIVPCVTNKCKQNLYNRDESGGKTNGFYF